MEQLQRGAPCSSAPSLISQAGSGAGGQLPTPGGREPRAGGGRLKGNSSREKGEGLSLPTHLCPFAPDAGTQLVGARGTVDGEARGGLWAGQALGMQQPEQGKEASAQRLFRWPGPGLRVEVEGQEVIASSAPNVGLKGHFSLRKTRAPWSSSGSAAASVRS